MVPLNGGGNKKIQIFECPPSGVVYGPRIVGCATRHMQFLPRSMHNSVDIFIKYSLILGK